MSATTHGPLGVTSMSTVEAVLQGVGYRTASTVLMLVTPRGPWFTYSSTYNLHRATPVLAKLPYCSMPNN